MWTNRKNAIANLQRLAEFIYKTKLYVSVDFKNVVWKGILFFFLEFKTFFKGEENYLFNNLFI